MKYIIVLLFLFQLSSNVLGQPKIVFVTKSIIIDPFYNYDNLKEIKYKFYNRGNAPLVIESVISPHNYFAPWYSKDPIMPNDSGEIKIYSFHLENRPGRFRGSLTVRSNDTINNGFSLLEFEGYNGDKRSNYEIPSLNWKTLESSNYSIKYPQDWELDKSRKKGPSFFLYSPLESKEDSFKENVNLLIQDLSGLNIDLDKYAKISEEQIKNLNGLSIFENKRIKNDSNEYHKIIYAVLYQENLKLKFEQYYWISESKAYVLTLTCKENTFSQYQEVGEAILNSFVLRK